MYEDSATGTKNTAGRALGGPLAGTVKRAVFEASRRLHLAVAPSSFPQRMAIFMHAMDSRSRASLAEGIDAIKSEGFRFCTAAEFVAESSDALAYLSFDDNYSSWVRTAEVLSERGVSAMFYCNTIPYDPESGPDDLEALYDTVAEPTDRTPLTKDELRKIKAWGHEIGCHTHRHRNLGRLDVEEGATEVLASKRFLEEILEHPVTHFSIPFGMSRHLPEKLKHRLLESGIETVAYALPGMLWKNGSGPVIHRTMWREDRPLRHNMENLRLDCSKLVARFGRSPIG